MGVDSGLPDFRGTEGFWKAYPPFAKLGLRFEQIACPFWFQRDPARVWGFYGHRLALYRRTTPHAGFGMLRDWAERCRLGGFVYTSNVDGHFQRAGFSEEQVVECHGSLLFVQCQRPCSTEVVEAGADLTIDETTFRAEEPMPRCPGCGDLRRPNVLRFGDPLWVSARADAQTDRLESWLARVGAEGARLVIVELGAGSAIPTVRRTSERTATAMKAPLIRINLREPEVPAGQIGIAGGALEVLRRIAPP